MSRAQHLDDEHAPGESSWPHDPWIGNRAVVCDKEDLHTQACGPCTLCGDAKVESIARVVVDDEQAARGAGDGVDRSQDGFDGWGCKHLASCRGGEHASAHEASVHGLVARPAT